MSDSTSSTTMTETRLAELRGARQPAPLAPRRAIGTRPASYGAVLLDLPEVLRELRGLERHRGTSGRDRIDHRPGQHDDAANCTAGALVLALAGRRGRSQPLELIGSRIRVESMAPGTVFTPGSDTAV